MRQKYIAFLNSINVLPIETNWNTLTITHMPPSTSSEQKAVESYIKATVGKINGLYIYYNAQGQCLYIGKGKPVALRLVSHYRESFGPVPGDTKDQRWHRYFILHQGPVVVRWFTIAEESDRRITELLLDYILEPAFKTFR